MEISTSLCINFRLCIWAGPQARSVWVNFAVRGASGGLRLAAAYVIELVLWASKKKRTQNFMAKLTQKDASTELSQLRSYQIFPTYISTRDEENVCISYIMSDSESRSTCTAESLISSRDLELLLMVPTVFRPIFRVCCLPRICHAMIYDIKHMLLASTWRLSVNLSGFDLLNFNVLFNDLGGGWFSETTHFAERTNRYLPSHGW